MNRGRKGFTLVELLVVIAIIAILAAVAVPTALGIVKKGHQSNYETLRDSIVAHVKGVTPIDEYVDATDAADACKLDKVNDYIQEVVVTTGDDGNSTFVFTMMPNAKYTPKEADKTVTIYNKKIVATDKKLTLTRESDYTFVAAISSITPPPEPTP